MPHLRFQQRWSFLQLSARERRWIFLLWPVAMTRHLITSTEDKTGYHCHHLQLSEDGGKQLQSKITTDKERPGRVMLQGVEVIICRDPPITRVPQSGVHICCFGAGKVSGAQAICKIDRDGSKQCSP